jgi:transcriptional regulator with XRE-family HTH domain
LQTLLSHYGIHRPIELARVLSIDRRYAWMIWQGKRQFTPTLALKLYDAKGIPIHELLRAPAAPQPLPRGRPRKPPQEDRS